MSNDKSKAQQIIRKPDGRFVVVQDNGQERDARAFEWESEAGLIMQFPDGRRIVVRDDEEPEPNDRDTQRRKSLWFLKKRKK